MAGKSSSGAQSRDSQLSALRDIARVGAVVALALCYADARARARFFKAPESSFTWDYAVLVECLSIMFY